MRAAILPALAVLLFTAGCSHRRADEAGPHDHAAHGSETVAATYKPGHGLRLGEAAATFAGLRLGEVETRDVGDRRGVAAVPHDAVLRTVRGAFVFVDNGGWLLRTPVAIGADAQGWVEIREGLYEGDRVAVAGIDALWLAEISAVNGGVGCADGH